MDAPEKCPLYSTASWEFNCSCNNLKFIYSIIFKIIKLFLSQIKSFYHEHLHSDEEIRFIIGGGGYFDVRDRKDQWIRIYCEKNDLIVLPAGIYHRFTIDKNVSFFLIC